MSFDFSYSTVTVNGRTVAFSPEGNLMIDGQIPELNGPGGPVIDSAISQFAGLSLFKREQAPTDKVVTEGCTENYVYKVRLGKFDEFRKDRAWIAYKERILTETAAKEGDQVNHLLKAAKRLNKILKHKLNLEDYGTAGSVDMVNKLHELAKDKFIRILTKKPGNMLQIEYGRFDYYLDSAVKHIHLAFLRIFQEVKFSEAPEQFKGIAGTPLGHGIIWKYLSDSLEHEEVLTTIEKLKLLSTHLLVTPEGKALSETLAKKIKTEDGIKLVSDLNQRGAKAVADLLQQEMVRHEIAQKAYPRALEICKTISDKSARSDCQLLIASSFWDDGLHNDAFKLIGSIDSNSTKNDWYEKKADLLWQVGEADNALRLIAQVSSNNTKDNWYENKANFLWQKDRRAEAMHLIAKVNSNNSKDNWYVSKADLVWQMGERAEARQLIAKVNSNNSKDNWYVRKADFLFQAGERAEAIQLIAKVNSNNSRDNWYVSKADFLFQTGERGEARQLIAKVNSNSSKDDWYVRKADFLWQVDNKKEAKELIGLISSQSTKNNWIQRRFNEL